ncbi:hypothetical protein H8711_06460 [Clostridiaceae bacterium NSJ-31]|uniref:Baseplate protein J-like domain-containing protein n=1 Tax=Ligaoa zhengdingensis TaxID=2763658 RepID=A0A926I4T7_9FIRM|nr:hypothetical protein [Ligaoa zhengdingensis]MBC8546576.1 hypothetical protein [Ligaoa zhengdingensis]
MKYSEDRSLEEKLRELAASYTPEWRFSADDPDPGSVVELLCCGMIEESQKRFGRILHKHKVQYLNLFDRLKEEPVEAARTYVKFYPVAGLDEPVYIPKGTQMLAETGDSDQRIIFETVYGITATNAELEAVYATDGASDRIVALMARGQNAETARFTAFDLTAENRSEHLLLLGYDRLFDGLGALDLTLRLSALTPEGAEQAAATLCSGAVRFGLLQGEEIEPFDSVAPEGGSVRLVKHSYTPVKTELGGAERYLLAARAEQLCDLEITGIELSFGRSDIPADEIFCNGVLQNTEHFLPFGRPMEIYAECGIECREVLARRGARVEMSFDLDFEEFEQLLPEYETDEEYKVIMKRPRTPPHPAMMEVKPDYVLLEYYGQNGWRRLLREEHAALLFNGSAEGSLRISFTVPNDMAGAEDFPGDYRLRLRLLRADSLYQLPARQFCPVIDRLRFSYSYGAAPQLPDYACTRNNFEVRDVTALLHRRRVVRPFYNSELEKPAMYLGFGQAPWGTPVSLYFDIENNEDRPVDFTAEYLSPEGFAPLKVVDNTAGMLYSETMLAVIPKDIRRGSLFGQDLYWVRLINHNDPAEQGSLPVIRGIHRNMAQARNLCTRVETFYVDDIDTAVTLQLAERNILHAAVWINERDGDPPEGENWVRWQRGAFAAGRGRAYRFDPAAGQIGFEKNIFSTFPLRDGGPAVKVEYQSYQGADANVPAGSIRTLNRSIRYVSRVENPIAAYGGYDGYNERTSAAVISNMLRTRGRAVSRDDYFDLIAQVSYGVRRIKCCTGVDQYGAPQEDAITIAVLIEEYEKGSHIFSAVKEQIREKLLGSSGVLPLGKSLILAQPYFVRLSVRLWLECGRMEHAYDLQKEIAGLIATFIDPLEGGFEGRGWEIGELPTMQQILAFLKIRSPEAVVTRTVLTAQFGRNEYAVNDDIYRHIRNPFAMAVNGEHTVYVDLALDGRRAT